MVSKKLLLLFTGFALAFSATISPGGHEVLSISTPRARAGLLDKIKRRFQKLGQRMKRGLQKAGAKIKQGFQKVGRSFEKAGAKTKQEIFKWSGKGWQQVGGNLSYVSVSGDGQVLGVNKAGQVHQYGSKGWVPVDGNLKQISVGPQGVQGVNASNQIWRR